MIAVDPDGRGRIAIDFGGGRKGGQKMVLPTNLRLEGSDGGGDASAEALKGRRSARRRELEPAQLMRKEQDHSAVFLGRRL